MSKTSLYKTTLTALCLALCIVLPISLHGIPNAGIVLSPMHIPVLLCGVICGPHYGLLCGILGPLLSAAISGMPGPAMLPGMVIELAVYGLVSGLLFEKLRPASLLLRMYISLIGAMLLGRAIAGIAQALFLVGASYSWSLWASAYFITCFPGILLQLILIPIIYYALKQTHLLPE